MIYLIDDKKNRQKSYGWDETKFSHFENALDTLYTQADIDRIDFLKPMNCVLFHESFFDQSTKYGNKTVEIRERLIDFANKNPKFLLAIFSGSKNSRSHNGNIIQLPVNVLYQNLEAFVQCYEKESIDLRVLLFGENPHIEEILLNKLGAAIIDFGEVKSYKASSKNLFFRPNQNFIQYPHPTFEQVTLFNKVLDSDLSVKIQESFINAKYDNIFLPISFGPTLSDFNGLRLATHIRCTKGPNQLANIYIYSYVDHSFLVHDLYFDILKTKNVYLIGYEQSDFENAVLSKRELLTEGELSTEIQKIKIDPPKNYSDSHSIANEWAVFRWSHAIQANDDAIQRVSQNISSNLYFKNLSTIHPPSQISHLAESNLIIQHKGSPKILYVDDDAEKGWFDVFSKILVDINELDFEHLDYELDDKSQDELIAFVTEKVIADYIDLVILDYRLHPDDFERTDFHEITGLKLLKAIKEINPGIQVIMFSATNKVWNLQAMQEAGADGFIVKESPENSLNYNFTIENIYSFNATIKRAIESCFLKQIWSEFAEIKSLIPTFDKNLEVAFSLLLNTQKSSKYFNYAYLQLFLIIEKFIQSEDIFTKDIEGFSYVELGPQRCLVFEFIDKSDNGIISYKSAMNWSGGNYRKSRSRFNRRIDTNAIVSSLLIFRYGLETSGEKNWSKIYKIRNEKAAHPESGIVTINEIQSLVDFIKFLLDQRNVNPVNVTYSLPIPTLEEKLEALKNKFR